MRRLLVSVGVFVLALVSVNVGLHFAARHTQRGQFMEELARPSDIPAVLCLGNSLMDAAFDREVLASAEGTRFINTSLGQTTPLEHALMVRYALEHQPKAEHVIYGYFDDQLNLVPTTEFQDFTGNRALVYEFPRLAADLSMSDDLLLRPHLYFVSLLPMVRERSSLWVRVEKLRRELDQIGMPEVEVNRFGRVEDFAFSGTSLDDFKSRMGEIVKNRSGLSVPVRDIFAQAHEAGVRVTVLEMPMPTHHRKTHYATDEWQELRALNRRWIEEAGGEFLAATDWVPDDGFSDAMHLNAEGAGTFSRRLLRELGVQASR